MSNASTPRPIALITGSSRGLGRSAALHLPARGIDVIVTYRSRQDEAQSVVKQIEAQGGRAAALALDVSQTAGFPAFVQSLRELLARHWQRDTIDHLVNNGGTGLHLPVADTTEAQFDELMNTHLKGPFFLTQALLPVIRDGGSILNISSGLTRFSVPGYGAYATMKGGLEVLSRYLAKELGPRGIRVNSMAPGAVETDFNGGALRSNVELNRFVSGVTALGRAGLPDDIGPVVASLLSQDSHWISGQRIEASGGMFL
ncbi:SDR family NAD(P)-dependent oxidoreductase [Roseateles terrae]|uniref:NAD(P)-dependent dehydrogenase (Short-subunit alcohol dehydrogenase family) n=1 Tax=Roseateles terrae TaxID=431060 RepID=A0ABR6GV23_9BURK|nr:SDR family oxidoreductase [Roseateles terrae]MBB3195965.1 NAD(P)-dependent dehydrogenase (short-subunit alcohol dehydrogenase family) [Roseateles terrae]OWQ85549.1 short-chain dehydrogenase [Roseateles terrae]